MAIKKRIRRRYRPRKPQKDVVPRLRVNQQIRFDPIVVIDENKVNLGEMSLKEALVEAEKRGLDLVEVSPKASPPVCKFADNGKLQYQRAKRFRQNKAHQKKTETKGVRLGMRTEAHDLAFKKKQTEKFLLKGHKVKLEIRLRGREKAYQDMARESLTNFIKTIEVPNKIEEHIKRFPGGFHVIIAPE